MYAFGMKFAFAAQFTVESLSAHLLPDKLVRAGIPVLSARTLRKNTLEVRIRAKDVKKTFAILRGSCYNIENLRYCGLSRLLLTAFRAAGLLFGALLFLGAVLFSESRVLRVEVVGGGAYYAREVVAALREEGVGFLSPMPKDTGRITARILALPRVEFCAFKRRGSTLTVEVQCAESAAPIAGMPLVSSVSGVISELIVLRGTPCVNVGDAVEAGQTLVENYALAGEEKLPVLVLAKAKIKREVDTVYALSEAQAAAQALLDYGEFTEIHTSKTQRGWRVWGVAEITVSLNLA